MDLWRPGPGLTPRKLKTLIDHLPAESATMTALRVAAPQAAERAGERADPAHGPWSQADMLLASVVDALRRLEWAYAVVHSKGSPPKAPEPITRPGVRASRRPSMTVAQYKAMTGQEPPLRLVQGG